jgi:hypothetical protein
MRFVSRPVEIEAMQWTGEPGSTISEIMQFCGEVRGIVNVMPNRPQLVFYCAKSDAWVTIDRGDWIIAERDGIGFYPCVDAQFRERYESIELPVEDW